MLSLFYRSDGFHSTLTIAVSSPLPAHTLQVTFSQLCRSYHSPIPTVTGTTGTLVADTYERFLVGSISQVFRGAYRQYFSYFAHLSNACQIILSNLLLRLPVPRSCTARVTTVTAFAIRHVAFHPRSSGRHRTHARGRHRLLGSFPVHG